MPCVCPIAHQHRHFLPHLPPGSMRCQFSPEMVSPLPHAMMHVFAKLETDTTRSPISPPPPPLILTASSSPLIPKPSGEVSHVRCGGYTLKNVLEQEHGWENGLYHKIRVYITRSWCYCHTQVFSGKSMLSGRRIFGHIPCLFHSSSKIQEQTYSYL